MEAGCGRCVRQGAKWCRAHARPSEEAGEERAERAEEFRRRLAEGEYRRLFDDRLKAVIGQAAAERGLVDEIGALRVVLARLLLEEEDLTKLVSGVARLAGVAVQAARAQRTIAGDAAEGFTEAINQILAELDGE